jgi:hypothetical protein
MPAAYASSKSSNDADNKPQVDTMTAGDSASAAALSKDKDGGSFFQTSETTGDQHGTHTKKTWGRRSSDGNTTSKDSKMPSKDSETPSEDSEAPEKDSKITPENSKSLSKQSAAKEDGETDDSKQGVFAKAGNAFAAVGGAVASAAGGKAVASAE